VEASERPVARARDRARSEAPRACATLTLPPVPSRRAHPHAESRAGKSKAKATKGKGKKAETPETSSRKHWTEEEETALSKYHDRLTKTWNKKEVPDWDAIVRKMIVSEAARRPSAARARASGRAGGRERAPSAGARSQGRHRPAGPSAPLPPAPLTRAAPRRAARLRPPRQDDGFPERSILAARAHYGKL